jgi:hypothetical protein
MHDNATFEASGFGELQTERGGEIGKQSLAAADASGLIARQYSSISPSLANDAANETPP